MFSNLFDYRLKLSEKCKKSINKEPKEHSKVIKPFIFYIKNENNYILILFKPIMHSNMLVY